MKIYISHILYYNNLNILNFLIQTKCTIMGVYIERTKCKDFNLICKYVKYLRQWKKLNDRLIDYLYEAKLELL